MANMNHHAPQFEIRIANEPFKLVWQPVQQPEPITKEKPDGGTLPLFTEEYDKNKAARAGR
jgi:hypothetical protein